MLKQILNDKAYRSAIVNVAIKPIGIILSLIYTPLLLSYLGNEQYGVWVSILSVINWINYCDIGIGNGLRNVLTILLAQEKFEDIKKAVSTGYICLTIIAGVLLILIIIFTFICNWNSIFGTSISVQIPLLISFIFISINFVLALCNTLLYTLQKSEFVSIQSVIIQFLNIIGVLLLIIFTNSSLIYISILFGATTFITRVATTYRLFKEHNYLIPNLKSYDSQYTHRICSLGLKFFVAQIAALILFTTDNLLVSHFFGASEVTPFSIADKVFNTGFMCFSAITVPFWSKTTEEITKKNFKLVHQYFRNLNFLALFFGIACIVLALVFKPLVKVWLQQDLKFNNELITIMCSYYIIYAFCGVSSPFINGMGGVNGVMVLGIIQAIANIPLSIIFAKDMNMGVVGIRLGTFVVVLFGAIFQFIYFYNLLGKMENNYL